MEGTSCGLVGLEGLRKPTRTSTGISGLRADILTRDPPDAKQEHCVLSGNVRECSCQVSSESRALRGPRSPCSRVVFMLCRPRLVKKPSFALEIRFPHVAMKFQTDCSGLLHNKYGSLFPQSRASQSQRGSQNSVARCLLFKARRNLIFCVEMRRPGPAIRRRTDVMRAICYLKVRAARPHVIHTESCRPNLIPPQYALSPPHFGRLESGSVRCGTQMCRLRVERCSLGQSLPHNEVQ